MTRWLLIYSDGTVGRTCGAEDKWAAEDILGPTRGQFVVSALSWHESQLVTLPDPQGEKPTHSAKRYARLKADPEALAKQREMERASMALAREARKVAARQAAAVKRQADALRAAFASRESSILRGIEARRAKREQRSA